MQTGSGSNLQHYNKLKKMKDAGKLPASFEKSLSDLDEQYRFHDYIPPPPLSYVWKAFWKIRRTKSYDNPINFTDLRDYAEVTGLKWNIWETDIILRWDREYYAAIQKNKD